MNPLRQLILMLSSDQPGEVIAAAAAITRQLKKVGSDWHDLADGLLRQAPQPPSDGDNWRAVRAFCLQHRNRLRPREIQFLENLGAWRGDLTERQASWLAAIRARLRH